ncbi:MAG: hypothetical protein WD052_06375 [Bacteroidales bacterium]
MKKRVFRSLAGFIILASITLPACEFLEDCGTCEFVTDDGTDITYGTPLLFCGDSYADKVNSSPTTIGGTTTYWNCY